MTLYRYDTEYARIETIEVVRETKNYLIGNYNNKEIYINNKTLKVRGENFYLSFKDEKLENAIKRKIVNREIDSLISSLTDNKNRATRRYNMTLKEVTEIKKMLEETVRKIKENN